MPTLAPIPTPTPTQAKAPVLAPHYGSRPEPDTLVLRKCSKGQQALPDQVRLALEGQSNGGWKNTHAAIEAAVTQACAMLRAWPKAGAVCVDMTPSGSFVARYDIQPQHGIIIRRIQL